MHVYPYYRLCLPESVNDGTSALTDELVVPLPRLPVDRLTNGTQNPQAGEVIPAESREQTTPDVYTVNSLNFSVSELDRHV